MTEAGRGYISVDLDAAGAISDAAKARRAIAGELQGAARDADREMLKIEARAARTQASLDSTSDRVVKASKAEADALGRLRVEQLKLDELRSKTGASAARLAAAEERVAAAQRKAADSATASQKAQNANALAQERFTKASNELADAMKRQGVETDRVIVSNRKLAGAQDDVDKSSRRTARSLDDVGRSAAKSGVELSRMYQQLDRFSNATLKIGSVATALASATSHAAAFTRSLAPAVGLLAALPGSVGALGAGIGTAATGIRGFADALKDANKAATGTASSATKVAAASRKIEAATRAEADARGRLQLAEARLAKLREGSRPTAEAIAKAEEAIDRASRSEADARERLAKAEQKLADLRNGKVDPEKIAKAEDAVGKASIREADARGRLVVAETALADLRAKGGSASQIAAAEERVAAAQRATADAAKTKSTAETAVRKAREGSRGTAQQIADAEKAVAKAHRDVADAVKRKSDAEAKAQKVAQGTKASAEQIAAAEQAVARAARAVEAATSRKAAAESDASKATVASTTAHKRQNVTMMASVKAVLALQKRYEKIQDVVQTKFWANLDKDMKRLADVTFPDLQRGMVGVAKEQNAFVRAVGAGVVQAQKYGVVRDVFAATERVIKSLTPAVRPVVTGLLQIVGASADLLTGIDGAGAAGKRFEAWAKRISTDGSLKRWFDGGVRVAKDFGKVIWEASRILGGLFGAASEASGTEQSGVAGVAANLKKVADVIQSPAMQQQLRDTFGRMNELVGKAFSLFSKLLPILVDYAPAIMAMAAAWRAYSIAAAVATSLKGVGSALAAGLSRIRGTHKTFWSGIESDAGGAGRRVGGKYSSSLGSSLKAGLAGLALGAGMVAWQKYGEQVDAASQAQLTFGRGYPAVVTASEKSAAALALPKTEFIKLTTAMGDALRSQGFKGFTTGAMNLVGIGRDLAAKYGGTTQDAVRAFGDAFAGNVEPLRKYGINLNGVKTATDKYTTIVKQSETARGEFQRHIQDSGASAEVASAKFDDLIAKVGGFVKAQVVDLADELTTYTPQVISKLQEWGEAFDSTAAQAVSGLKNMDRGVDKSRENIFETVASVMADLTRVRRMYAGEVAAAFNTGTTQILSSITGLKFGVVGAAAVIGTKLLEMRDRAQIHTVAGFVRMGAGVTRAMSGVRLDIMTASVQAITRMAGLGNFAQKNLVGSFATAKTNIGKIWAGLPAAVQAPINLITRGVISPFLTYYNKTVGSLAGVTVPTGARPVTPIRRAAGSWVPGWSPNDTADNIPALLTAGEFVTRRKAARRMRREFPGWLEHVNQHGRPPGYRSGGTVGKRVSAIPEVRGGQMVVNYYAAPQGYARGGLVYRQMESWIRGHLPWARVSSGYRPGSITSSGNRSFHSMGMALDLVATGKHSMMEIFNFIRANVGSAIAELIYTPARGRQVKNGKNLVYSGRVAADHWDHVHWAMRSMNGVIGKQISGVLDILGAMSNPLEGSLKLALKALQNPAILKNTVGQHLASGVGAGLRRAVEVFAEKYSYLWLGDPNATDNIPAGSGVEKWRSLVVQALSIMRQPASLADTVLRRMQQESGGNARAVNNWDINAKRGDPSKGLMQVIGSTFRAYAMPGYNRNIYDPLSNVLASMRYAVSRYGSLSKAYNRKGGYAEGGDVDPDTGEMLFHRGGSVRGKVRGYSPSARADNIRARLTAGEWVHQVAAVRYYGDGAMRALNERRIPAEIVQAYASGGGVTYPEVVSRRAAYMDISTSRSGAALAGGITYNVYNPVAEPVSRTTNRTLAMAGLVAGL